MKNEIVSVETIPPIIKEDLNRKFLIKSSNFSNSLKNSFNIENNKFFYVLNQIPIIKHALKYEKGFTAIIPEKFKEGLKNGTLKIMQGKDGSSISTIVDANGQIVHHMRLKEFTTLVNPAELSQAMNQMCMQMQLAEIQKNLIEFRIEVNSKLNEILKNLHDNRIITVDSLKLSFERFQKGEEITRSQLLSKIDDAKANLFKEIDSQINSLSAYRNEVITKERNSEIQAKIVFILESIQGLQETYLIECYLNKNNSNKIYDITNVYTQALVNSLTPENLKLLDGFSDFNALNLNYNIWEKDIMPQMNNISIGYSESKLFLSGVTSK